MKENIYKKGKDLGLGKEEIDKILSESNSNGKHSSRYADVYKAGGKYGTVSIKDF